MRRGGRDGEIEGRGRGKGGWVKGGGRREGRCGERTRITIIGIRLRLALCDFEIAFVGHLIEGVFAPAEEFAGVAVARLDHGLLVGMFCIV